MKSNCLKAVSINIVFIVLIPLLGAATAFGQGHSVSGTVTDGSSGKTLPGVNIKVKGTTTGTSTGAQGQYDLTVESLQDTLVFSFIGYQTRQVPMNGRTEINIAMQPQAISGQEMVVVGYTQKQKKEVTGSVSEIQGENLVETSENNITQTLQGKMAGVVVNDRGGEPGNNNAEFFIRGKATLGNNNPLFIIDGVPRSKEDFANLASNDIKNISVLKDASAAIYGARAANGVILVTTKKGQIGKPTITLNSSYSFQTINKFPDAMNAYQRGKYRNEALQYNGQQPLWSDEAIQHFKKGDKPLQYPNTNWSDIAVADHAPQTHHHLAAQGGTENIQYYMSGDYLYQQGLQKSGDFNYDNYQLRARINSDITQNLKVGMNLMGRKGERHTPITTDQRYWQEIVNDYPWIVARWPNGSLGPGMEGGSSPVTNNDDKYGWTDYNHYTFNSLLSIEYQLSWLAEGLELSGYANFNYKKIDTKAFGNIWNTYEYNVQSGKYINPRVGHTYASRIFDSNISSRQLKQITNFNNDRLYHIQLKYENSFENHNINAFMAYEQSENSNDLLSAYRRGLPSDKKIYLFSGQETGKDNDGSAGLGGRVNYFGDVSYNYAQTYLIDFSLRYDGSFNFPKGNRFGLFPAISGGWNIKNEPFMDGTAKWLNNLKLRASWGKMGNDLVPSFQYLTTYKYGGSGNYFAFGQSPQARKAFEAAYSANPNITWETAYKTDIGLDLGAWGNLLNLTLDIYSEKRRNILIARNASVPDYTAITLPDENLGEVNNKGIEVSLSYKNTVSDVNYNIGGNMTYHKSEIKYMDEASDIPSYQKKEGHPIHSWLVYKANGLFRSQSEIDNSPHLPGTQPGDIKYVDVNGDGEITGNDEIRKYISPIPKIQFAFNAGLNYKNVGLNILFQGQAQAEQLTYQSEGIHGTLPYFKKRWTPQNTDATFPRAFLRDDFVNSRPSTFWLYDASFLRLKNVRLSYTLPGELTSNLGISHIGIYLNGRNLATWDHMVGNWDPERKEGRGYGYPQIQTFTAGIKVKF